MTEPLNKAKGISIRQRIMLGFILLIGISSTITLFNIHDLREFHTSFQNYRGVSSDTNQMIEIKANIADLQRAILAFTHTERSNDIKPVLDLHNKITRQIADLRRRNHAAARNNASTLEKLDTHINDFRDKIESLAIQKEDRSELIEKQLSTAFDETDEKLHTFYNNASKLNNPQILHNLWFIQHKLALIETRSALYFSAHAFTDKQLILATFAELKTDFSSIREEITQVKILANLQKIEQSVEAINQLFHTAVQADRNYLFLSNIVIAGESGEIANLADLLKTEFTTYEEQEFKITEQRSLSNQQIAIMISIAGSFFAFLIALFIGNKLSAPLVSITNTFSRLARGEYLESIPGIQRNDEIGRLAQAANVFRETNLRTTELLEQSKAFAAELKQREHELEQAAEHAQEASVAKSQFLANMSHELRTPMNAILGMLSLLQKTELNTRQDDYVHKTENAARSLLSLLNDILDLSKAEAGKIELDPVPFDLRELVQNINLILSTSTAKKNIELHFSIQDSIPHHYLGDALRLQQVLINLGSNAVKFTEKGEVNITITQTLNEQGIPSLCFSVRDSGIGIAKEHIAKIFSGFTQAEASTTRRFGGTGLGLAISQKLVSLMGGTLEVESVLGVGSRFYFSICLPELNASQITELKQQQQQVAQQVKQRLKGINILLVEDNLTNQQIAMELLEIEGAHVTCANHGQEAVTLLETRCKNHQPVGFDLVLMDLQMPVMDGISATHAIRHRLKLHSLPIIAMTANAMSSDRENCLNAGMNDHVGKPFDISQLITVILTHSGRPADVDTESENDTESTPPATAEPQATFVELDFNAALGRLGGNKDLYKKMLPRFANTLTTLPDQLQAHLLAHDYEAASRLLHSLKGLSSTMGFMHLSSEAAHGEKLFKSDVKYHQANEAVLEIIKLIKHSQTLLKELDQQL